MDKKPKIGENVFLYEKVYVFTREFKQLTRTVGILTFVVTLLPNITLLDYCLELFRGGQAVKKCL